MRKCLLLTLLAFNPDSAMSFEVACSTSAESQQYAMTWLDSAPDYSESWKVVPAEIRELNVPGVFRLGVQITPWTDQQYSDRMDRLKSNISPEMVAFRWYKLGDGDPVEIGYAHGGVNSLQGFGPVSGVMSNEGPTGLTLFLQKTNCISRNQVNAPGS